LPGLDLLEVSAQAVLDFRNSGLFHLAMLLILSRPCNSATSALVSSTIRAVHRSGSDAAVWSRDRRQGVPPGSEDFPGPRSS
jgi:hypothetical protein